MTFDSTISIMDIISVLAIFLTFITILQVKQQRTDTLKPYLTIKPCNKSYIFTCTDGMCTENIEIYLSNIGNDLSKNIKVETLLCDIPNMLLSKAVQITDNSCCINNNELILLHHNIDFTYCESKEQKDISFNIYGYIVTLCHIYADILSSNNIGHYNEVAKVAIKISYCNILGKNFYRYIILQLVPIILSTQEISFNLKTYEISKKEYIKCTQSKQ